MKIHYLIILEDAIVDADEDKKWIKNLNKYAEKCKKINSATCYETDEECANSLKNINKNVDLER